MLNQWSMPVWPRQFFTGEAINPVESAPSSAPSTSEPIVWESVSPGVDARALVQGPEMVVAQVRFARGAALPIHRHRASQAGYVLEGRLLITLPDEQLTVAAGQCFMLPAGVPHQVRATAKSVVLDLYSPGADASIALVADAVRGVADFAEEEPCPRARAFAASPRRSARRARRAPGACPTLARAGDAA